MTPEITRTGLLDMQVCVPETFTDQEVEQFANRNNLAGTQNGWKIRKQGDVLLAGQDERVKCSGRNNCVHLMLDC